VWPIRWLTGSLSGISEHAVRPATAGLRRQDAGANDEVGPKDTRQEPRVTQFL
jgi:hypothetical protein